MQVPASEVARHIVKAVPPDYPSLAAVAHIQGRVSLGLTIAPDGSVTQLRAISGHPMLLPAALDAVRRWKYQPFLVNGASVPVQSSVYILFALGPEAGLEQKYYAQEVECRDLLRANRNEEAGKTCSTALETAKALKSEGFGLRIAAYGNAGLAAYHLNLAPDALQDFQERLKQAKKELPPDSEEWFNVYHDLALTFQASGQMEQAENEYRETEKALIAEKKSLDRSSSSKEYIARQQAQVRVQMGQTVTEHAALLRQMGRNSQADELERQLNLGRQVSESYFWRWSPGSFLRSSKRRFRIGYCCQSL
jgi:TonB family protein